MENFNFSHVYVGAMEDGTRVYVDASLRTDDDREWQTVDHETIKGGQRLSLTGQTRWSAGQITSDVRAITRPRKGLTAADIEELLNIWEEYHLNDMQALCSHQTMKWEDSTYGRRMDLDGIGACPVSGYRPGSAWLFKPVPDSVLERVKAILTK
jgi:hypothetical protein